MLAAGASFETSHGSKYLQQLCKHFAHKVDVEFTERHGECRFSCGTAMLDADDGHIRIEVSAADAESLAQTKHVVESHLARFAFRESVSPLVWNG
ncbi:MAG: DUF2218 domain-containing protein [Rhizobiaceae bacterium]|nr:DUF2218 domain-containing protein [Rhizobiaceae bacterium]